MINLVAPIKGKEKPLFEDQGDYRIAYIDLIEEISTPNDYLRDFEILRTARRSDKVVITINTPGGRLDTAVQLIDAIEQCKGKVTARLTGDGFSAGSLIFLSCKNKEVGRFGSLMIHRESGGMVGKGSDTEKQMEYMKRQMEIIYTEVYGKYLSDEQLKDLMKGTDLWFDTKETKELING